MMKTIFRRFILFYFLTLTLTLIQGENLWKT
jgi:hypothetical protein